MSANKKTLNRIRRFVFYGSLAFIIISFISITVCHGMPVEFADVQVRNDYYDVVMGGLPIAILFTMSGTIRMSNDPGTNIAILFITLIVAFISFFMMISIIFKVSFGVWADTGYVLYNKKDPAITIREQQEELGVFGSGGKRIVKLTPLLWYWNRVGNVDTATLNKSEWIYTINQKN